MTSADLRSIVKTAATGLVGARIWPNGLGFDLRGTQYTYSERLKLWSASRPEGEYAVKYGEGSTPQAAKRAAGIGRDKHTQSRPL